MQRACSTLLPPELAWRDRFDEDGLPADLVRDEIGELCAENHSYTDGTVFNSICSQPLELAGEVFTRHLITNLGDNRIFPGLRPLETRVTRMLGQLLGHPEAAGGLVSGGTEANLLALVASLEHRTGSRRPIQVLVPESIHYSFEKFAAILPIELVRARLDSRYRVDADDLRRKLTRDTALIVATAGTSECGSVDDVPAVAEIAAAAGIPLHIDAATGGFLIPFARELGYELPQFDFSVPEVTSITVDPHKYGCAPVPAGYLLFRDQAALERLRFASHYQGTRDQFTLLGTRPGASLAAVYAALRHMGRSGYRQLVGQLFTARDRLRGRLEDHGHRLAYEPDLTILGVHVDRPADALAYLQQRRIIASVSKRLGILRVVVHRHLRDEHYAALLAHLDRYRRTSRGGVAS
jgi:tyrosine decarboxylase / aspartate 1-decarboxylase